MSDDVRQDAPRSPRRLILLSIAALIVVVALVVLLWPRGAQDTVTEPTTSPDGPVHVYEFTVTVSAGSADVGYGAGDPQQGSADQKSITVESGTWTESVEAGAVSVGTVTVRGDRTTGGQQLACSVSRDGEVISTRTGSVLITCSASSTSAPEASATPEG